jgi:hypothetical protein
MNKRELTKFFKAAGLNKEQIQYAHVLKSMYGSTPLERIVEMAKDYQSMSSALVVLK